MAQIKTIGHGEIGKKNKKDRRTCFSWRSHSKIEQKKKGCLSIILFSLHMLA